MRPPPTDPCAASEASSSCSTAQVIVRPCSSTSDCCKVAALCAQSFPEEVHSQGLSVQQWSQIESEELKATPSWWRQIGLACEGDKLLGVVVLTVENEADDSITWAEYSRRVGCGPTILSMLYDRVLDEALLEHECLIDFIAVSPEARGKGVGSKLMRWAEQAASEILAETETAAVAAHGVEMSLWVAADNAVAVRLYEHSGYTEVRRTGTGACRCMASAVFKWFLGHPVWIKMHKMLPVPPHVAAAPPLQQSIAASVPTGACTPAPATRAAACKAAAASSVATPDAQFVNVPLDTPATQQQAKPAVTRSPAGSFLHKLSRSLFGGSGPGAAKGGCAPQRSGLAAKAAGSGSLAVTPRIAAVGSGLSRAASLALEEQQAQCSAAAGSHPQAGSSQVDGPSKPLEAPGPLVELQRRPLQEQPAAGVATVMDTAAAHAHSAPCTASVASASVASLALESDSDSDGEERSRASAACAITAAQRRSAITAAQRQSALSGRRSDVFELVSLSSNSMTTSSAPAMA